MILGDAKYSFYDIFDLSFGYICRKRHLEVLSTAENVPLTIIKHRNTLAILKGEAKLVQLLKCILYWDLYTGMVERAH